MNAWIKTGLLSLALLGFAACGAETADVPAEEPAAEAPVAEEPMAEEPMAEEPATEPSQAETDCLTAVAEQVGVAAADLSIISAEMGETSTAVLVEVPEAQAPWQCNWGYQDGEPAVLEVFYTEEG